MDLKEFSMFFLIGILEGLYGFLGSSTVSRPPSHRERPKCGIFCNLPGDHVRLFFKKQQI